MILIIFMLLSVTGKKTHKLSNCFHPLVLNVLNPIFIMLSNSIFSKCVFMYSWDKNSGNSAFLQFGDFFHLFFLFYTMGFLVVFLFSNSFIEMYLLYHEFPPILSIPLAVFIILTKPCQCTFTVALVHIYLPPQRSPVPVSRHFPLPSSDPDHH